jgi:hypothetical protein
VKWLWLCGAFLLAVFAFGVYRAAGNPAFWLGLLTTAAGAMFRFLMLHGRSLTPAELDRLKQGNTRPPQPWRADDEDHH